MFFIALLTTATLVSANSRGVGIPCNVDVEVGSDDVMTKSDRNMWWAKRASWAGTKHTLRTADTATPQSDPTTYTPGQWTEIYLRALEKYKQFTGLVLYAENKDGKKVGQWAIPAKAEFHMPGECVVHRNANQKHYLNTFRVNFPQGTGPVTIKALVKYGLANPVKDGAFYWPNTKHLQLTEGGSPAVPTWFEGEPGQSCNEVCTAKKGQCAVNVMKDSGQSSKLYDVVKTLSTCTPPMMAGCSASSPAVSDDGCFFHDGTCQPATLPPTPTRKCTSYCGSGETKYPVQPGQCCKFPSHYQLKDTCNCLVNDPNSAAGSYSEYNGIWTPGAKDSDTPSPTPPPPQAEQITCEAKPTWSKSARRLCACSGVTDTGTPYTPDAGKPAAPTPAPAPTNPPMTKGTCTDKIKNQDEVGVDCGGATCPACTQDYTWSPTLFGPCSKTCGGGLKEREVSCLDKQGNMVASSFCKGQHEIPLTQACNVFACPEYKWVAGDWGECNQKCGGGARSRPVDCTSNGIKVAVSLCNTVFDPKPDAFQVCNTDACTGPTWKSSPWSACSKSCGGGTQERTVTCIDKDGANTDAAMCKDQKPEDKQNCNTAACVTYAWHSCPWDDCTATCGGTLAMIGVQQRKVVCRSPEAKAVDPTLCTGERPVNFQEGCSPNACTGVNWMADAPWSLCDASNQQYRTFHCHAADGTNLDAEKCAGVPKPLGKRQCAEADGCPKVGPDVELSGALRATGLGVLGTALLACFASAAHSGASAGATGRLGLILLLALAFAPSSEAHNWMTSPARGNEAGENNGFNGFTSPPCPQQTARVHTQVGIGQKFPIEWAAGHGFGSFTYFAVMKAKDASNMAKHTEKLFDDYLSKAPAGADNYLSEHPVHHVMHKDHAHALLETADVSKDYHWVPSIANTKGVRPAGFRNFGASPPVKKKTDNARKDDKRAKYKSEDYPWLISVHKFSMRYDFPDDADTTMLEIPAGEAPGKYIVQYMWSGYYDCIDVNVLDVPSTDIWGSGGGTSGYDRTDHCEFIDHYPGFAITSCMALGAADTIGKCAQTVCNTNACDAIQVVPTKLSNEVLAAGVWKDKEQINAKCTATTSDFVCFGLKQGEPQVGPTYRISSDPEDPVFYSSCFRKSVGWTFQQSCSTCPPASIEPGWSFGRKCISCATMRENARQGGKIPLWPFTEECRSCENHG